MKIEEAMEKIQQEDFLLMMQKHIYLKKLYEYNLLVDFFSNFF